MSSSSKKILTELGPGKPSAGFLANVNVDEIQKLWNEYYPDGIINTLMEMNLLICQSWVSAQIFSVMVTPKWMRLS